MKVQKTDRHKNRSVRQRDKETMSQKGKKDKRRKSTYKIHIKDKRNRRRRKEQPRQLKIEKYKT